MAVELSVAIIFKNEIRCIERCLKSLQPLKARLSCEIVMADTGSTDGSREIAERYADTVFDFPWIDDFSAARNAVFERCFGAWTLVVDCDEWLDPNIDELVDFMHGKASTRKFDGVLIKIWDYMSASLDSHTEFMGFRLMRMGSGPRFKGAIHEQVVFKRPLGAQTEFKHIILHHDGYVMLNDGSAEGRAKRTRNRGMIGKELEKTPDDLRLLMQYIESSVRSDADYFPMLRRAIDYTKQARRGWKYYGPIIFREAVFAGHNAKLSEWREWAQEAETLFPQSYYVSVDIAFVCFADADEQNDNTGAVRYGERYMEAYERFPNDSRGREEISQSTLKRNDPTWAQFVRIRLANAHYALGRSEQAAALLGQTDWTLLDAANTKYLVGLLKALAQRGIDVAPLLNACWTGIHQPAPSAEEAQKRVLAFQELIWVEEASTASAKPTQAVKLSVAMIFKNELRCMERCLKSLQPLKRRVSCEIVMADTGSTDGSREIAERYADTVFDFPWVDDFSAARNAVIERCTGEWVLVLDCDEWLDEDVAALEAVLYGRAAGRSDGILVTIRNYSNEGLDRYSDFLTMRLLRTGSHPRYRGIVHESPYFEKKDACMSVEEGIVLHHDGYVAINGDSEEGRAKRARNVALLRKELERAPEDLRYLKQMLDIGIDEPDYHDLLRRAVSVVEAKKPGWQEYGPSILCWGVQIAYSHDLAEMETWAEEALALFPNSYFTRIDVEFLLTAYARDRGDSEEILRHGEAYLRARRDFETDKDGRMELQVCPLQRNDDRSEQGVRMLVERTRQISPQNNVSRELLDLAQRVRAILQRYPADDPAIIDLKNSDAYKKVAYLIED